MVCHRAVVCLAVLVVVVGSSNAVYTPYQAPYSGSGYGSYSGGTGYGTCGALKVTEVLDQIYCHHGYYTRFTSTDLAAIKVALFELGLVSKFIHITSCLEYVNQAIYFLKELKEETYKSYDTSELSQYYSNAGSSYTDIKGYLNNMTTALQGFEDIRRGYLKANPAINFGTFVPDTDYGHDYKTKRSLASGALKGRGGRSSSDTEYDYAGDYTCSYISASYCSANSLVVKNVLYRVLKALYSLVECLTTLYDYIKTHDCGNNNDNKYALLVTADAFGSTLCAAQVLLEAAKYEYNLYTSMAGSSGYNNNMYGRSGSGSSSSPVVYPYGMYMVQGPYRYTRNVGPFPVPVAAAPVTPLRSGPVVFGK